MNGAHSEDLNCKPRQSSWILCALCVLCIGASALDREAFTFTNYELQVQLDPAQQGLGATGFVTLRNDSDAPQKSAALQISSSLTWISIKLMPGEKALTYVTHPYESDIDHTGSLSEAVVTLPQAIAPGGSVQLEVTYSGQILQDGTRLERIGAPKETAAANDWDVVSSEFTAVRGAGYVAWYPVAMESVSLKDGHDYGLELGRWRAREAEAQMVFSVMGAAAPLKVAMNDLLRSDRGSGVGPGGCEVVGHESHCWSASTFFFDPLGYRVPIFFAGKNCQDTRHSLDVCSSSPTDQVQGLITAALVVEPQIREWLGDGRPSAGVEVFQLAEGAAAFDSGLVLLTPMSDLRQGPARVRLAHTFAHAAFYSPRPWIYEGLANFMQALVVEQENGRDAAIDYMRQQLPAVVQEEKENQAAALQGLKPQSSLDHNGTPEGVPLQRSPQGLKPTSKQNANGAPEDASHQRKPEATSGNIQGSDRPAIEGSAGTSLIAAGDELLYRSKAMYVWWMLRDMLGDAVIKGALGKYKPDEDKDSAYMQRLLEQEARTRRVFPKIKLEQFFDDWVYRDRGLPDCSVKSTFTRKLLSSPGNEHYMATITVANIGNAGAEIAVTISAGEHERVAKKLAVAGRGEASIRIPTVNIPTSVELNDGSVPESDTSNNSASIAAPSE